MCGLGIFRGGFRLIGGKIVFWVGLMVLREEDLVFGAFGILGGLGFCFGIFVGCWMAQAYFGGLAMVFCFCRFGKER